MIHRADARRRGAVGVRRPLRRPARVPALSRARASRRSACWCRASRAAAPCELRPGWSCTTTGNGFRPEVEAILRARRARCRSGLTGTASAESSALSSAVRRALSSSALRQLAQRIRRCCFFNRGPVVPVLRFTGPIGMATPLRPGLGIGVGGRPDREGLQPVQAADGGGGRSIRRAARRCSRTSSSAASASSPPRRTSASTCSARTWRPRAATSWRWRATRSTPIPPPSSAPSASSRRASASTSSSTASASSGACTPSGKDKGALDPFQPERPEDVARLKELQRNVHDVFIGIVKERRAGKLKGPEEELFSGAFWSAAKAVEYGLIDGIADLRGKMQAPARRQGAAARHADGAGRAAFALPAAAGLRARPTTTDLRLRLRWPMISISAIEARALWSRFGL